MIVGSPSRLAALVLVAAAAACGRERARQPTPEPQPTAAQEVGRSPAELSSAAPEPGQRASRQRRAAGRAGAVRHVAGTLERRSAERVTIRGPGAERVTLVIDRGTRVTLDGRVARVEALPEGSEVRVAYESGRGERPAALSIEGRSPGGRAVASEPRREAARCEPGGK